MQRPVDFKTVESIKQQNTVVIVNNFVVNTAEFLNKFSYWCEKKLSEVASNIERLEITMNILEAKLASIPGLEGTAPPPPSTTSVAVPEVSETSSFSGAAPPPPPPPPGAPPSSAPTSAPTTAPTTPRGEVPDLATAPPAAEENTSGGSVARVKDDPVYERYFKMLRLGVAVPQIKMQMKFSGLDPDLLDNPDAPVPGANRAAKPAKGDSEDEEDEEDEKRVSRPVSRPVSRQVSQPASRARTPPPPEQRIPVPPAPVFTPPPAQVFSPPPPPAPQQVFSPPPPPAMPQAEEPAPPFMPPPAMPPPPAHPGQNDIEESSSEDESEDED
eukprot:TRINITY_DN5875_c0_g1_i1.p1 TRINITY_DN5875_c0_g1~~TRINITY_DN5875_c0_g1_i1.p1  ORF type:complete len:328 (+),score=86.26 TRINITY_DN5875_c0_g1_i1:175-1158(+)